MQRITPAPAGRRHLESQRAPRRLTRWQGSARGANVQTKTDAFMPPVQGSLLTTYRFCCVAVRKPLASSRFKPQGGLEAPYEKFKMIYRDILDNNHAFLLQSRAQHF